MLAQSQGLEFQPDAALLYKIAQEHQVEPESNLENAWSALEAALNNAFASLGTMHSDEGKELQTDLSQRIDTIERYYLKAKSAAANEVSNFREQLLQRLQSVGLEIDLEDERVLKEIALFADRIDVTEEKIRLESHFVQFRNTLEETEPVGRKLDFLCQEIYRELNTLGNKTKSVEVGTCMLDSKNELERIREQVQNIQ